ncbi:MAG: MMPL family transporter [Spirochaetales bacterium]|nr:MMPL family transporter [Spirochaetales bacterium]
MNKHFRFRAEIEDGFTRLGYGLYRYGKPVLAVLVIIQLFLIFQIPNLNIDTSTEGMLHDNDPELLRYNTFREEFGRDDLLMVTVKSEESLINPERIHMLDALHSKLSVEVPFLDEVNSLINARDIQGSGGYLTVDDLFASYPETETQWKEMEDKILKNPMYGDFIISHDGKLGVVLLRTQALIPDKEEDVLILEEETTDLSGLPDEPGNMGDLLGGFDLEAEEDSSNGNFHYISDAENSQMVKKVEEVLAVFKAEYGGAGSVEFSYVGTPAMTEILKRKLISSIIVFMIFVVLVIIILLAILFRQPAGVILPLMVAGFSISGTLGIMALTGVSLKIPTQILPSFLVSVSIGASIHILSIFFGYIARGTERKESIARAMGHSGLAITMTSLTTMGGLLSFAGAKVAPISDLGVFGALGVLLSLIFTTFLLPSVLSFIPLKKPVVSRGGVGRSDRVDLILKKIAGFACRRAGVVTGVSILILLVFLGLSTRIVFGHDVLSWLPEKMEYLETTDLVDERMRGSASFEIVVDTGVENGIYDTDFLNLLDSIGEPLGRAAVKGGMFIGKTMAVSDLLKETHQALNGDDPDYYRIPDSREAVAQELLLFENSGSDDLKRLTDTIFSKARVTVKVPWADALIYGKFLVQAEKNLDSHFAGYDVTITGLVPLLGRTLSVVIASTKQSYILAYVIIAFLMLLFIGNFRLGIISMLPNIFPIIITLGVMGAFGIVLDMFTMLIGSIAMGLAVDDTIHFMHNYNRIYRKTGDSDGAVLETFLGTGRAMLSTTAALSAGFLVFTFAEMRNLHYFGLLTGFTLIMALAADFLLAPALVTLLNRRDRRKKK